MAVMNLRSYFMLYWNLRSHEQMSSNDYYRGLVRKLAFFINEWGEILQSLGFGKNIELLMGTNRKKLSSAHILDETREDISDLRI